MELGTVLNYTNSSSLTGVRYANCIITTSIQRKLGGEQDLNPILTVMLTPNALLAVSGLTRK